MHLAMLTRWGRWKWHFRSEHAQSLDVEGIQWCCQKSFLACKTWSKQQRPFLLETDVFKLSPSCPESPEHPSTSLNKGTVYTNIYIYIIIYIIYIQTSSCVFNTQQTQHRSWRFFSLEVGRCNLQTLCDDQGNHCCNQGEPEIHRQLPWFTDVSKLDWIHFKWLYTL